MNRLKEKYSKEVVPSLMDKFNVGDFQNQNLPF